MLATKTLLAAILALVAGFLPMVRPKWGFWHALAAAAIVYPVAESLVGFVNVAPLLGTPTELQALTPEQLAEIPFNIVKNNLGVPAIGLALVAILGSVTIARQHVQDAWPGWPSLKQEVSIGWALAPLFLLVEAAALVLLAGPASFLQTGDESAHFANATWQNVAMLTLVPAIVEEVYYRGLLQGMLEDMLPTPAALHGGIAIQALLFGIAHGGYLTFAHVMGPLLFGLAMGYLRVMGGLGACVVAHGTVNLLYFSVDPGAGSLGLQAAVLVLAVTGLLVAWSMRRTLKARLQGGPRGLRAGR